MPQKSHSATPLKRHRWSVIASLLALLACVALAACGGSSSSSSSTASASSTAPAGGSGSGSGAGGGAGGGAGRFTQLRSCLAKQGITLPTRPSGSPPAGGSGGSGGSGLPGGGAGGIQLPKGVTRAQLQEALKKCGGGFARGGGGRLGGAAGKAAFTKFASCMRANGVNLPAPNTSGKGPVFNTKGINTSSATFKAAESKCRSDLGGAFGGGARPGAAPNGAGAPPSGAAGAPPAGEAG